MTHRSPSFQKIQLLAFLGVLLSLFSLFVYYQHPSFGNILVEEIFTCPGILQDGSYATLDGILHFLVFDVGITVPLYSFPIPLGIASFLLFAFLFAAAQHIKHERITFNMKHTTAVKVLKLLLYVGAVYSLYLAFVMAYVLYTFCITSLLLTVLIFMELWLFVGLTKTGKGMQKKNYKKRLRRR